MKELILLGLKTSIILIVFGLGLNANLREITHLFRKPGLLIRSLLSMNVIMPTFAAILAAVFNLHPATKIALVVLGVSPIPPVLPKKQFKAGGQAPYTFSLLVVASLFAIVFIPLAITLIGIVFSMPLQITSIAIAKLVLLSILIPLSLAILTRHYAPALAKRLVRPVSLLGSLLLLVSVLPILFTAWPAIRAVIGNGTLVALAAFIVVGLAVGHFLGGPKPEDRSILALATSSRHPAIALTIATANFPQQKLVPAAILLYLLLNVLASTLYIHGLRRTELDAKTKA
jgi:BASS family bile acid:Na+ symporter